MGAGSAGAEARPARRAGLHDLGLATAEPGHGAGVVRCVDFGWARPRMRSLVTGPQLFPPQARRLTETIDRDRPAAVVMIRGCCPRAWGTTESEIVVECSCVD